MQPRARIVALAFAVAALAAPSRSTAAATRFEIHPGGGNMVTFESRAPMETFQGHTDQVSGWIEVNPDAIGDSVGVYVEVDLASLDTGIEKRNAHMRENHLETDKFPKAVFRGATVLSPDSSLQPGSTVTLEVAGEFDLHGVKRRLQAPVEVTLVAGNGSPHLHVVTHFDVVLADYSISRPKFLFLKLGDTQHVTVDATAVEAPLR